MRRRAAVCRWLSALTFVGAAGALALWQAPAQAIRARILERRYHHPASGHTYNVKAVHFAGSGLDLCSLSDAAFNTPTGGFTVAFWMNIDAGSAFSCYPVAHHTSGSGGWYIILTSSVCELDAFNSSNAGNFLDVNYTTGAWHLIVAGWDGTSGANKIYLSIDDSAYSSTAFTHSAVSATQVALNVGAHVNSQGNITGAIDELGYWSGRLLTQTEVGYLWNSGAGLAYYDVANNATYASLQTSLTAWWDCDDTGGQNMADASGNGKTLAGQNSTSTYTSVTGVR
jgi:hypothetical protein